MFRLLLVGLGVLAATAATGAQSSAPPMVGTDAARRDDPVPEDPLLWAEEVRLLLQGLCIVLNCQGSSAWTEPGLESMVEAWITTYEAWGVRPGMTPEERGAALTTVGRLLLDCRNDPGVLPGAVRAPFVGTLAAIEDELLAEVGP